MSKFRLDLEPAFDSSMRAGLTKKEMEIYLPDCQVHHFSRLESSLATFAV